MRILLILFLSLSLACSLALGAPPSAGSGSKKSVSEQKQPKILFELINGIVANNVRKCLAALPDSLSKASARTAAQVKATVDATKQLLDLELARCNSLEDPIFGTEPSSAALCVAESLKQGPAQAQLFANQQSINYLAQKLGTTLWTEVAACLAPLQLPTSVLQQILDSGKFLESDAQELLAKHSHLGLKRDTSAQALARDFNACVDELTKQLAKLSEDFSNEISAIGNIYQDLLTNLGKCGLLNIICISNVIAQATVQLSQLPGKLVAIVQDTVAGVTGNVGNFISCAIG